MQLKLKLKLKLTAVLLAATGSAFAAPITPTFDSFGTLVPFTGGGSGIPKDAVATTNLAGGAVLGLTATQRFTAPALSNNGAGSFTALAGSYTALTGLPAAATVSGWNFDWYIASGSVAGKTFKLFYDFDPATANDQSTHGVLNFGNLGGTGQVNQNSQNLGFGFLATTNPLIGVTAPAFAAFSPNALGTYTFALVAFDANSTELGRSAIAVTVVPEPGSHALMLAGLGLVGWMASRRRS
jgi:hypothetical protein